MTSFTDATSAWIASSGVIPNTVRFDLVPSGTRWMIVAGLLALICALLSFAVDPAGMTGRRRKLRLVRGGLAERPHAQQT